MFILVTWYIKKCKIVYTNINNIIIVFAQVKQDLPTDIITVIVTSCCNPKHLTFCHQCVSSIKIKKLS